MQIQSMTFIFEEGRFLLTETKSELKAEPYSTNFITHKKQYWAISFSDEDIRVLTAKPHGVAL